MKPVIIESPYAASTIPILDENIAYARACMRDCLMRNEAPFAAHALYTLPGVLDDDDPNERSLGMQAGFQWQRLAALVAVYTDRGISPGMKIGIVSARDYGIPVEYRSLKDGSPIPSAE